ncbi:hypothetical protein F2Q70_00043980 [Brassica cretica]|uniref:Uncharacterized protein n=1 Tax=Brassica cretica TaxID=69181 RepID=A0A8S9KFD7_BRACR|nr:hypothetical protein F2Q70_00043980 [Brassica cretica]
MEFLIIILFIVSLPIFIFFIFPRQPSSHIGFKSYPIVGSIPGLVKNRHRFLDWTVETLSRCPTQTAVFRRPGNQHEEIGLWFSESTSGELAVVSCSPSSPSSCISSVLVRSSTLTLGVSQVVDRSSGETLICVSALFREGTRDAVVGLISVNSASLAAFLWQGHVTGHDKPGVSLFLFRLAGSLFWYSLMVLTSITVFSGINKHKYNHCWKWLGCV